MMDTIKIGVIDLGQREDSNSLQIIEQILDYAVQAEEMGFSRFWLAEHHYSHVKNHPYTNPDVLLPILAGITDHINIGSAGVSIALYSPYSVVSNYKLLGNLYEGRIDLGLSKGIPDSEKVMQFANPLLSKKTSREFFKNNLETISNLLEEEDKNLEENHVLIPPFKGSKPNLWYLSTSFRNFEEAIKYKTNYCISLFHNFGGKATFNREEIEILKERYYSVNGFYPKIIISLAYYMADTIEVAAAKVKEMDDLAKSVSSEGFVIEPVTADILYNKLKTYNSEYGFDEFVLYDVAGTQKEKLKNLQEISEKMDLLIPVI